MGDLSWGPDVYLGFDEESLVCVLTLVSNLRVNKSGDTYFGVTCGNTDTYFRITELRPISLILSVSWVRGLTSGARGQNPHFGVYGGILGVSVWVTIHVAWGDSVQSKGQILGILLSAWGFLRKGGGSRAWFYGCLDASFEGI